MIGVYRSVRDWLIDTLEPLRPVYDAWMRVIAAFSWVLVRLALVLMFFTVFLLYGIVLRIVGKDPMQRELDPQRDSYWGGNILNNTGVDDFKKQY